MRRNPANHPQCSRSGRPTGVSRSAHGSQGLHADQLAMSERGMHHIADDLSETWIEDWAGAGVAEIETYLAKHAAFLLFLESQKA
jgi:hypothetical protein